MKIAIATDSSSGISSAEAVNLGVKVLPIPVLVDDEIIYESEEVAYNKIYQALSSNRKVSTSQPAPFEVQSFWQKLFAEGYDHIVYLPIARELSSSYDSARNIAETMPGKVTVVDHHRISIPLREAVLKAKIMADNGVSPQEICENLQASANNYSIFITVNALDQLKKSGRINPVVCTVGNLLHIKPVVQILNGQLNMVSRQRGLNRAKDVMFERLLTEYRGKFFELDTKEMTLGIAGTALSEETIDELKARLLKIFPCKKIYYNELPACVACHVGIGAVGIGFCFD